MLSGRHFAGSELQRAGTRVPDNRNRCCREDVCDSGLGAYFIDAANNRDHFLILGLTAFGAIALMFANLAVDIAYAYIDPRIRYE